MPRKHGLAASAGGVSTDGPPSTAHPDRSPLLVMAVSLVVRLVRCSQVRPAPYRDHLAEETIPRSLAASEPKRSACGRPAVAKEFRDLVRDMSRANPLWGSPRLVGELRKLGINVAKSTVEKYRVRPRKPPSQTWKAFLMNHVKDLVACHFFTVPTVTLRCCLSL
jgi:hypothetical protein